MAAMDGSDPLTLPEGTRLFYIGPPKTGTTSLQEAARAQRETLEALGVYYPGTARHHRHAVFALMQEPDWLVDRIGGEPMIPGATYAEAGRLHPMSEWTTLLEDLDSKPSTRAVVTHEWAASASDEEAEAFVRGLGRERTHVVITLRALSEVLAPQWIETLKEGGTATFEGWLEAFFDPTDELVPPRMRRYLDHAGVVERWARVLGRENVTAIVVDKANRGLLLESFERLLGLPGQTLTGVVDDGLRTNRSMSLSESQVIQRVNAAVVHPDETSWRTYLTVVRWGAITELLDVRTPDEAEGRVLLPTWAVERARREGSGTADRIARSGVRVVGDLGRLHAEPPTVEPAGDQSLDVAAMREIAVVSLTGAVRATTAYEKSLARRIDRAREQKGREVERREKVQLRLDRQRAKSERLQEVVERVRARNEKLQLRVERQRERNERTRQALEREREKHNATRERLTRLRNRTIRDQVTRLPAEERPVRAAESFTTHELARALRLRLGHKLRTGRSRHLG